MAEVESVLGGIGHASRKKEGRRNLWEMKTTLLLDRVETVQRLARRLVECPEVTRFDTAEEKEAWALAHTFADLERSFRLFLDDLLPDLLNQSIDQEGVYEILLSIGEELRHVEYNIRDSRFFEYI